MTEVLQQAGWLAFVFFCAFMMFITRTPKEPRK